MVSHRVCAIPFAEALLIARQIATGERPYGNGQAIGAVGDQEEVSLKDDDPDVKMKMDRHASLQTKTGADFGQTPLPAEPVAAGNSSGTA